MSETLTKVVVDCSTGEQSIVPLTAEEIAQREADSAAFAVAEAERIAAAEAAADAKASGIAKLLALGLTEDEANALVK
jgi:TctA family transporter